MRILFITSTRIGDAILSTGLLHHLIRQHPDARVTVACGPAAASLFEAVPGLERLLVLDKMAGSFHWPWLWASCLGRYWNVIVDLRNSPLYYLLPAGQRWKMGSSRGDNDHRVLKLARIMGLEDNPPSPHLWLADADRQKAEKLIPDGPPVLALGPTANWRAKSWRAEHFASLIQVLTAPGGILPGARVAVFGRDDERPGVINLLESIPPEQRIDLVGRVDLPEAFACLRRSNFYVGNDSGLMHLAAASGIPTLGLFGPSLDELYAPWGERAGAVRTPQSFSEIFPENFDHRTSDSLMDGLTVDHVAVAAENLWRRTAEAAQ
ncbi:MAG: glycosyltransferase family 9 protein [Rhodospirillales bacterium]|nr:glycosyltransferase family 9 protein [Rhodospirillales bacterium]